jgi:hypothetical protein
VVNINVALALRGSLASALQIVRR